MYRSAAVLIIAIAGSVWAGSGQTQEIAQPGDGPIEQCSKAAKASCKDEGFEGVCWVIVDGSRNGLCYWGCKPKGEPCPPAPNIGDHNATLVTFSDDFEDIHNLDGAIFVPLDDTHTAIYTADELLLMEASSTAATVLSITLGQYVAGDGPDAADAALACWVCE